MNEINKLTPRVEKQQEAHTFIATNLRTKEDVNKAIRQLQAIGEQIADGKDCFSSGKMGSGFNTEEYYRFSDDVLNSRRKLEP